MVFPCDYFPTEFSGGDIWGGFGEDLQIWGRSFASEGYSSLQGSAIDAIVTSRIRLPKKNFTHSVHCFSQFIPKNPQSPKLLDLSLQFCFDPNWCKNLSINTFGYLAPWTKTRCLQPRPAGFFAGFPRPSLGSQQVFNTSNRHPGCGVKQHFTKPLKVWNAANRREMAFVQQFESPTLRAAVKTLEKTLPKLRDKMPISPYYLPAF